MIKYWSTSLESRCRSAGARARAGRPEPEVQPASQNQERKPIRTDTHACDKIMQKFFVRARSGWTSADAQTLRRGPSIARRRTGDDHKASMTRRTFSRQSVSRSHPARARARARRQEPEPEPASRRYKEGERRRASEGRAWINAQRCAIEARACDKIMHIFFCDLGQSVS